MKIRGRTRLKRNRLPLMALSIAALLAGLWAGLARLGWQLPRVRPTLSSAHGPLMVAGFLGTVIGLERAVALSALSAARTNGLRLASVGVGEVSRWTYAVPALTGLGALALVVGVPGPAGPLLITLGSLGLVLIFVVAVRHQPALFTATMALGAFAWAVGNAFWLAGWPIYRVVPWWASFLVLTIAGERLELARLSRLSERAHAGFLVALGIYLVGLALTPLAFDAGVRFAGVGMTSLAAWLLRYDVAGRTVRQTGLTRFIAVCLLSGYLWLGVSGLLSLVFGGIAAGPYYDAALHTLFLGFVFAMIFGHAPVIFPAVLGVPVSFQPAFYGHLIFLHLSLGLRVAGDLGGWSLARQWGGLLNVIALLLFLIVTGYAVARG